MRNFRCWVSLSGMAVVIGVVWLAPVPILARAQTAAAKTWSAPKTPWGDPDLQGIWTNWDHTPFQAPDPNDPAAVAAAKAPPRDPRAGGTIAFGAVYFGPVSPLRPGAVVVDPPNGRVPVRSEKVERRGIREGGDHWENHSLWGRCITLGTPGPLLGGGADLPNRAYHLLQIPGYVVIFEEQVHETRVIPLDGRPHVGPAIRLWNGDSRGRWEGQTLVVETTNFNNKGEGKGDVRTSEALRVVERFTRLDAKTLTYEATIEDPTVYTRPWTGRQPHNLDPKYVIYEYACHEGNTRFMEGVLEQGRLRDAEEAEAAKKKTNQP